MAVTGNASQLGNAITASWERCELRYKLARDAARPILRLQSTEVAPRLEEMVERSGGRHGIIRQLAEIAANAGHCLVVTDADGVLVRLEGNEKGRATFEEHGIAVGSCWDERIAGTNGVTMALSQGKPFTVSGQQHYFSALRPFACSAVPLFDAENNILGALNFSMLDRRNASDYLFATQLLGAAADRIQRVLFERRFQGEMIVSVSVPQDRNLLKRDELVAVNEAGIILGTTAGAHNLAGEDTPGSLRGRAFELVFGADARALERIPERVMSAGTSSGPELTITPRTLEPARNRPTSGAAFHASERSKPKRTRLAPSLRQLATGSARMATMCSRAMAYFQKGLPFLIQGESGTGKSALIEALRTANGADTAQFLTIDCASLSDGPEDRQFFQTILEQTRVSGAFDTADARLGVLVFENVDELPGFAQAKLRMLMGEIEADALQNWDQTIAAPPRILATCRQPLMEAVAEGRFRDDLYFLLAGTVVELPPLCQRERLQELATHIAGQLAGTPTEISKEAMAAISAHSWPGNVRELKNAIQHALMEGDGRRITAVDLLDLVRPAPSVFPAAAQPKMPIRAYDERAMIEDALAGTRWNVSQAARNLGIGRATIHRKMKQYGICRP